MRINPGQAGQIIGDYLKRSTKSEQNSTTSLGDGDKVSLSSASSDLAKASQAYQASPEIRENRLASLKTQIQNNTYNVDSGKTANAIISGPSEEKLKDLYG